MALLGGMLRDVLFHLLHCVLMIAIATQRTTPERVLGMGELPGGILTLGGKEYSETDMDIPKPGNAISFSPLSLVRLLSQLILHQCFPLPELQSHQ